MLIALPLRIVHNESTGTLELRCVGVTAPGYRECPMVWQIPPANNPREMNDIMSEALGHVQIDHVKNLDGRWTYVELQP